MSFKNSKLKLISITAKNFRSIGNMPMELTYSDNKVTTMVGSLDNGAGKSTTLVHALYYVLFDKAYAKGGKKTSLINSRSNKDCLVELELIANGDRYKISRGQKPTFFEIIKNGVKIEDEAALKDYQTNIGKIIGMDERVFCNTVALGVDKFVPFVDMSTPDRRAYAEQMLDVTIFSQMNMVTKGDLKEAVTKQTLTNTELMSIELNIKRVEQVIQVKKDAAASQTEELKLRYAEELAKANEQATIAKSFDAPIQALQSQIPDLQTKLTGLNQQQDQRTTMYNTLLKVESNIAQKKLELQRKIDHKVCTTCGQDIPEHMKEVHIELDRNAIVQSQATLDAAKIKYDSLPDLSEEIKALNGDIAKINNDIRDLQGKVQTCKAVMATHVNAAKSVQAKIEQIESSSSSWTAEQTELDNYKAQQVEKTALLNDLTQKITHYKIIEASLKDEGAKAKIIAMYLPFINERINFYLEKLNLFLQIELDMDFELLMLAPDRKNQTLADLSTGQKRRIDLATMLSWRDVARLTASCDCNILILDEILENLSENGVADFVEMWQSLEGADTTALYVITQRVSEFEQLFDRSIIYKLVDDMTCIHSESQS